MLDHGGNLDLACRAVSAGGRKTGSISPPASTGSLIQSAICSRGSWTALPSRAEIEALHEAARSAIDTTAPRLALAGAQAAIQLLPRLAPPGARADFGADL